MISCVYTVKLYDFLYCDREFLNCAPIMWGVEFSASESHMYSIMLLYLLIYSRNSGTFSDSGSIVIFNHSLGGATIIMSRR